MIKGINEREEMFSLFRMKSITKPQTKKSKVIIKPKRTEALDDL